MTAATVCNVCKLQIHGGVAEHFATIHPAINVFQGARLECSCGGEHISGWCERAGANK